MASGPGRSRLAVAAGAVPVTFPVGLPVPATVVITAPGWPGCVTFRMTLSKVSEMYRSPRESSATPLGRQSRAPVGGPPSPYFAVSGMFSPLLALPPAGTSQPGFTEPAGGEPAPDAPLKGRPATVWITPEGSTKRMTSLPSSAMYTPPWPSRTNARGPPRTACVAGPPSPAKLVPGRANTPATVRTVPTEFWAFAADVDTIPSPETVTVTRRAPKTRRARADPRAEGRGEDLGIMPLPFETGPVRPWPAPQAAGRFAGKGPCVPLPDPG